MPRWKSKIPPISLPCNLATSSRRTDRSAELSLTAASKRWISWGTWSSARWGLGIPTSSASSTMAVWITTPGETPMPFLISIRGKFLFFLAELVEKQFRQLLDGLGGVVAFGFDAQRSAFGGGQDDHLHYALSV